MAGNLQGQPDVRKCIHSVSRAFPSLPFWDRLAQSRARDRYSRPYAPFTFTLAAMKKTKWLRETMMSALKYIRTFFMMCSLVVILHSVQGFARQNSHASSKSLEPTPAERDGQHDFDFEIGTWKTHLKRLVHPLTGSTTWVEYEGT